MKNIGCIFIDKVVHYFDQISLGIKTCEQELIIIIFEQTIKQRMCESCTNISLSIVVFECGFMKNIVRKHSNNATSKEDYYQAENDKRPYITTEFPVYKLI